LAPKLTTEFNIEGYPTDDFLQLVEEARPAQVTLVPDPPGVLTSNAGWDTHAHLPFLKEVVARLKAGGMRTSLFVETNEEDIAGAAEVGADRIELYTEAYATGYPRDPENAVAPFAYAAEWAHQCGLGVNAGHDLSLENLGFFAREVPHLQEVSIGHALVADALRYGMENTVKMYLRSLEMATLQVP
jgi:pyridoxine 5-phosphate synthase